MDRNGVIGNKSTIPWMKELPNDMKKFIRLTKGAIIIVGRKTLEECIKEPLKGRTNIVVSRTLNLYIKDCAIAHSVEAAIAYATSISLTKDNIWIIGGSEIYRQTLDLADELYLTVIDHEFEGDSYFPRWSTSEWELTSIEEFSADEKNVYAHRFEIWRRKNNN